MHKKRFTLLPALLLALLLGATAARADDSGVKLTFSGATSTATASDITVTVTDLSTNTTASGVTATLTSTSINIFQTDNVCANGDILAPDNASGSGYANTAGSTITYTFTITGLKNLISNVSEVDLGVVALNASGQNQVNSSTVPFTYTIQLGETSASVAVANILAATNTDGSYNTATNNNGLNYTNTAITFTDAVTTTEEAMTLTVTLTNTNGGCYAGLMDVELKATETTEDTDPENTFDFHSTLSTTDNSNTYGYQVTETTTVGDFYLTAASNANNILMTAQTLEGDAYYLGLKTGASNSCVYTLAAPDGYVLTGYTITGYNLEAGNPMTVTPAAGGSKKTFSSATATETLVVSGLWAQSTSFTLSSTANAGLGAKIAFTYDSESNAPTSYTVTIPEGGGFVTACFPQAVSVPSGSTLNDSGNPSPNKILLYTAGLSSDGTALELTPPVADVSDATYKIARYQIPAATPVVLGGPAGTYTLSVVTGTPSSLGSNVLTGNSSGSAITPTTNVYVLQTQDGVQQFVKVAANTTDGIPANSAYYAPSTAGNDALTIAPKYFCQTYDSKELWFRVTGTGTAEVVNPDYYRYQTAVDNGESTKASNTITHLSTYQETTDYNLPESIEFNGTTYTCSGLGALAFYYWQYSSTGSGSGTVNIPSSYTYIGSQAFEYSGISSITLPESLTDLGSNAFHYTTSLNSTVTIPSGVTEIKESTFNMSHANISTLPDGLTTIGKNAFNSCGNWIEGYSGSITIPASVTEIKEGAFYQSDRMYVVMENGTTPCKVGKSGDSEKDTYDAFYSYQKIILPTNCSQNYKTTDALNTQGWSTYKDQLNEKTAIRTPKDGSSNHYTSLALTETFVVPTGVTVVYPSAVDNNGTLTMTTLSGTAGDVIAANTPMILYGSTGDVYYTAGETATDPLTATDNMLLGNATNEQVTWTASDKIGSRTDVTSDNAKLYVMSYGESGGTTNGAYANKFGFYWDARTTSEGATAQCNAYKALLLANSEKARSTTAASVRGIARSAAATKGDVFLLGDIELPTERDVTVGTTGYATFYADRAVNVPEGITASSVTADGDQLTLNAEYQSGDILPAYTPVVLQGEPGTYTFTFTVGGTRPAANDLHGTLKDSLLTGEGKYYKLSLSKDGQNVGFYYGGYQGRGFFNAGGKAYLYVNPATASTRGYALDEATTTAISSALTEDGDAQAGATRNGAATYDLQGRRVAQPARGLYIMGGKKVIIR